MTLMQKYAAMLRRCHETLLLYARQHRAKADPTSPRFVGHTLKSDAAAKAEVNEKLAAEIASVLAADSIENAHGRMVGKLQKSGDAILAQMTPLKIMCLHMAGGAASEGGELFDAVKRWALFDKSLDVENVIEELGDIEFFLQGLRENLNITREQTLERNAAKLAVRYPGHEFSDAATIARADKSQLDLDLERDLQIADAKHAAQMADLTPEDER